jgi:toxin secretion/phage lysis holin
MNDIVNNCKIVIAALGGVLGWLLGGFDSLVYALIAFVAIDYITGIFVAIHKRKVSSEIGYKGICKKVMIFLLVAIGNIIDQHIIRTGTAIRTMIIMFYLTNEGISIIENAGKLGVPIPRKLKSTIKQLCEKDCDSDNDSNNT